MYFRAIEMFQNFVDPHHHTPIINLPPSKIFHLLEQVLAGKVICRPRKRSKVTQDQSQTSLSRRQINALNGCVLRVPEHFYPSVYEILKRCPGGLIFLKKHLPQRPTLNMMEAHELTFGLTVEQHIAQYSQPDYRFVIVRVLVILATILERNPELFYYKQLNMDHLVRDSFKLYLKDNENSSLSVIAHFDQDTDLSRMLELETSKFDSYVARAVVNVLLGDEIGGTDCKLQ